MGFYGSWDDLNGDGEVDRFEKLVAFDNLNEEEEDNWTVSSRSNTDEDEDENYLMDDLEIAGLDYDELSMMDEDERRAVMEDAGLDPDEYFFC